MTGNSIKHDKPQTGLYVPRLSIVVPMLNEKSILPDLLSHMQELQRQGCEIILVDGGSNDGSKELAAVIGFKVVQTRKGRALQMNAGAAMAKSRAILFLHVDTRLPHNAVEKILGALENHAWGRFDVHISGESPWLRLVAWTMNVRSRLTGIATGDQGIFIRSQVFQQLGGFPEQALMEDVELSSRLARKWAPCCLKDKVITSGRRWLARGVWSTIWLMWRLRWAYWRGVSPELLAQQYR